MGRFMVSLGHFCEIHGPTVIMSTETIQDQDFEESTVKENSLNIPKAQLCKSCTFITPQDPFRKTDSNDGLQRKNSSNGKLNTPNDHLQSLKTDMSLTQLVNDELPPLLRTEDEEKTFSYVSTQYPISQVRYTILRHMITKTLSIETTYDSANPVFFGDQANGYTVALVFKIHDSIARGSERKFCFLVAAEEELEVLTNWDLITINFHEMVEYIKRRCAEVEVEKLKSQSNSSALNISNERFFRRSGVVPKPKSLVELLDDQKLFVKLHLWASELLKGLKYQV